MGIALSVALVLPTFAASEPRPLPDAVRHELVMLPYYGVFDDLRYSVNGSEVTLYGEVREPILKSNAEKAVQRISGVTKVVNNIKVLPLSPADNRIRAATYGAVFGAGNLYRYAMGAIPSIHIIVENGHVTLTGVVSNPGDRDLAYIRANSVPGVFSVTNHIRVAETS
jgi:hyperosmotically inducible protein